MAPHAGTAGLKVLLAGCSHDDLKEAQTFLAGEGALGQPRARILRALTVQLQS